jgi:hypothetical protein
MTQAELDREVAQVTGETVNEIRSRGFQLIIMPERRPRYVDWDAVQRVEPIRYRLQRRRRRRCAA